MSSEKKAAFQMGPSYVYWRDAMGWCTSDAPTKEELTALFRRAVKKRPEAIKVLEQAYREAREELGWAKPKPGSQEARDGGCLCPVMDNNYGAGRGGNGPRWGWIVVGNCPVHTHADAFPTESEAT